MDSPARRVESANSQQKILLSQLVWCLSCPVLHSVFTEPWLANDGHTYERIVLMGLRVSPITRQEIHHTMCKPNMDVLDFIKWVVRQHWIFDISRWLRQRQKDPDRVVRERGSSSSSVEAFVSLIGHLMII